MIIGRPSNGYGRTSWDCYVNLYRKEGRLWAYPYSFLASSFCVRDIVGRWATSQIISMRGTTTNDSSCWFIEVSSPFVIYLFIYAYLLVCWMKVPLSVCPFVIDWWMNYRCDYYYVRLIGPRSPQDRSLISLKYLSLIEMETSRNA